MSDRKYKIIYADPPWQYDFPNTRKLKRGAENDDYSTMTVEEICALPVARIADEDCALFIWGIWTRLFETEKVIKAWGFKYKTVGFVWVKTNRSARVDQFSFLPVDSFDEFFGMGAWTRANSEFCLIAIKGKPQREANDVRQIIYAPIDVHSRKPAEVRSQIVRLMGNLSRVELFAREKAEGWHVWGNEVESDIELAA